MTMRKGMILKIENDHMIVLSSTGAHEKIKNKPGASVGQSIYYFEDDIIRIQKSPRNRHIVRYLAMAAVLLLAFVFTQSANKPWAYLTVDINPSIELIIGKNNTVKSAVALNDDAKAFDLKHYKNLSIQEALTDLILEAQTLGFINDNGTIPQISFGYISLSDQATSFNDMQVTVKNVRDVITQNEAFRNVGITLFEASEAELKDTLKTNHTLSNFIDIHPVETRKKVKFPPLQGEKNLINEDDDEDKDDYEREKEEEVKEALKENQKDVKASPDDNDDDGDDHKNEDEDDDGEVDDEHMDASTQASEVQTTPPQTDATTSATESNSNATPTDSPLDLDDDNKDNEYETDDDANEDVEDKVEDDGDTHSEENSEDETSDENDDD